MTAARRVGVAAGLVVAAVLGAPGCALAGRRAVVPAVPTPLVARAAAASNGHCSAGAMFVNALNPFSHCEPLDQAAQTVTSLPSDVGQAAASGVMDQVSQWMVQAAQAVSGWVVREAGSVTSPELQAGWYLALFSHIAALAAALAALVALLALGSAALRGDPQALGEVIYGVGRAGFGTSVVVALTMLGLGAADAVANQFAAQMPAHFYGTLASQWGASGWGGFGAAALAFFVAFVATLCGLLVWLELLVREAAIYVAVLFFPVALAASVWPALRSWVRRLSMLLLMFVLLRPVVVIVLDLAGSLTAQGLSFGGGGVPHSVATILAGVVVFALAACCPWALMFLLGSEVGVLHGRGASPGAGAGRTGAAVGAGIAPPGLSGVVRPDVPGEGGVAGGLDGAGGLSLASLGGSLKGLSAGGVIGAAAGAAPRLGQHAAARIHVAGGRAGLAPASAGPAGGRTGSLGATADASHPGGAASAPRVHRAPPLPRRIAPEGEAPTVELPRPAGADGPPPTEAGTGLGDAPVNPPVPPDAPRGDVNGPGSPPDAPEDGGRR